MRTIVATLLALTLVGVVPARTYGQTTSLGGVDLSLGMQKTDAMAKLTKSFKVEELSDENWIVVGFDPISDRWESLGSVAFAHGKLSYITRKWESSSDTGTLEFTRGLLSVLAEVGKHGDEFCGIQTNQSDQPTGGLKEAYIICSSRSIHISTLTFQGTETASIDEVLREPVTKPTTAGAKTPTKKAGR